jgi:hypothetical protein
MGAIPAGGAQSMLAWAWHAVQCAGVTKPEKQDGTMELDVGQIDLLELALPAEPKEPAPEVPEAPRMSKGPPPLPPSLPPISAATTDAPSLPSAPSTHATPAVISARTLLDGPPPKQPSSAARFLVGMGGATALCVIAFFVFRAVHKTPPAPVAPPSASTVAAAPTHAFTMAPIEFTGPVSSEPDPEPSATPSSAPPVRTTTTGRTTPTTQAGAGKPPHSDDVIKVEN